jgi:acetyl esterase/lipase
VTRSRAFPAALQDTISAYAYLIRQGYTRIALAGDSAGAGLGIALMQYLAKMADVDDVNQRPDKILMPVKACFYSPWADLTFSHDYKETVYFDISESSLFFFFWPDSLSPFQRY